VTDFETLRSNKAIVAHVIRRKDGLMQVTDEMVRVACETYDGAPETDGSDVAMRAALNGGRSDG